MCKILIFSEWYHPSCATQNFPFKQIHIKHRNTLRAYGAPFAIGPVGIVYQFHICLRTALWTECTTGIHLSNDHRCQQLPRDYILQRRPFKNNSGITDVRILEYITVTYKCWSFILKLSLNYARFIYIDKFSIFILTRCLHKRRNVQRIYLEIAVYLPTPILPGNFFGSFLKYYMIVDWIVLIVLLLEELLGEYNKNETIKTLNTYISAYGVWLETWQCSHRS